MYQRLKVPLSEEEFEALCHLSEKDLRPLPDEVRAIVRERLARAGLLAKTTATQKGVSHA